MRKNNIQQEWTGSGQTTQSLTGLGKEERFCFKGNEEAPKEF